MNREGTLEARLAEVISDVQIPLDNIAYTIDAYLHANGARLDTETRFLLAGIRDGADRVAGSVRALSRQQADGPVPGAALLLGTPPSGATTRGPAPGSALAGARLAGNGPGLASTTTAAN